MEIAQLQKLQALEGKKLIWVGFDEETGEVILLFEGWVRINLGEMSISENALELAQKDVKCYLPQAESILKLKKLLDDKQAEKTDAVKEGVQNDGTNAGRCEGKTEGAFES